MKILIEVQGGQVMRVLTDQESKDIIIVDWDNIDVGLNPVQQREPDEIVTNGKFSEIFLRDYNNTQGDAEVYEELKRIHL